MRGIGTLRAIRDPSRVDMYALEEALARNLSYSGGLAQYR